MPVILIFIGVILIVAAYNNSVGDLAKELETDVPGFLKWGLAVGAVGALGWIPGAATISRWLLALVVLVLFLTNYQKILAGITALGGASVGAGQATGAVTPAAAYAANPAAPNITTADVQGSAQGTGSSSGVINVNAASQTATVSSPFGAFDPAAFMAEFAMGFGGFGGVV